jgi:Mg2+-importing ATPase
VRPGSPPRWIVWLPGLAILATVILLATHMSEERELTQLVERAEPAWLLLALALQAGTYLADAAVWRSVMREAGVALPLGAACRLGIAKLFVDQSLPTGGIAGTTVYVEGLRRRGAPRRAALAAVVVTTFAYYAAYGLCLAPALALAAVAGHLSTPVAWLGALFLAVSAAFAAFVLAQPGRPPPAHLPSRPRWLGRVLRLLRLASPGLTRSPALLARGTLLQALVVGLDTATLWACLRAVGTAAPETVVFASYMMSSIFRTLGILPGGLGTFEAASVLMLGSAGVPLAAALSATLLFRGFSFWLPMLPGMVFARRLGRRGAEGAAT